MSDILVTGAAGFIGKKLIEKLVDQGHNRIISLDNLFSGKRDDYIDGVLYLEEDTRNILDLELPFTPEIVFHLGEYSRIATSFVDIRTVFEFNIRGTFNVLEFCKLHKCKLIYAGSSSKFGNDGEDENLSPYAWTKSKNVELIQNYGSWFGLDYSIAYFYNVYGPGQISWGKYSTVIGVFESQYSCGHPLTVVSPGTQRRAFTHVEDVVNGLVALLDKGSGEEFSFGDASSEHSIEEVAQMFTNNFIYINSKKGDRVGSPLDTSKAEEILGWKAKNKLKDYINAFKEEAGL